MDKISLKVKECSEFETLGECHEGIKSVDEAIRLWKRIPPERMNGIKSIGLCLEAPGDIMDGSELDILVGKHFDLEVLEYVPDILENKQAQEMVKELVEKLPEMEIRGRVPEQLSELDKSNNVEKCNVNRPRHHR